MSRPRVPSLTRPDGTLVMPARVAVVVVAAVGLVLAASDPFTLAFYVAYAAVAVVLLIRRPRNVVSWLLIVIAFGFIGTTTPADVDILALQAHSASLRDALISWISTWSAAALFAAFGALAFVFPDGKLPGGRWHSVARITLSVASLAIVATMLAPTTTVTLPDNSAVDVPNLIMGLPDSPIFEAIEPFIFPVVFLCFGLGVVSLISRFRGSTGIARLQLRWLLSSVVFVLTGVLVGLVLTLVAGDAMGGNVWLVAIVAYPCVPIAIAIAVLRYRLFDLDRIVNRAFLYGALTAILAGFFAAASVLSQRVFQALTGQDSDVAIIVGALVVATLYTPVRKRIEAVTDRYLKYEHREYGAYEADLAKLLELIDPVTAARRLAQEVVRETRAGGVAILGEDGGVLATAGDWPSPTGFTEVSLGNLPFHAIRLGTRADGRDHEPGRLLALRYVATLAARAVVAPPRGPLPLPVEASNTMPVEAGDVETSPSDAAMSTP